MALKPLASTRDGYRYHWGEDDSYWCQKYRNEILSSDVLRRSNLFRRKLTCPEVRLSESDRAPQLKLDGGFTVTGEKGYCMVRATHGINRGRFYYEVTIDSMQKENGNTEMSAARVGWGQKYSNLQAPLGYDKYGYSYRSRFGSKFHEARGMCYDKGGGYGEGDTVGCMIELPYGNEQCWTKGEHLPPSIKHTTLICNWKKKDSNDKPKMLEEKDTPPDKLDEDDKLPKSQISFYKNGKCLGVAFEGIYKGFYYPSISLYKNCKVTVNFGPKFRYPPPELWAVAGDKKPFAPSDPWAVRPASDMAEIEMIDNCLSDMLYMLSQVLDPKGDQIEQEIKKAISS